MVQAANHFLNNLSNTGTFKTTAFYNEAKGVMTDFCSLYHKCGKNRILSPGFYSDNGTGQEKLI